MLIYNLIFLLFFHFLIHKIIITKYTDFKEVPVLLTSVIYVILFFLPSLYVFKNPVLSWYFICTICLLHYSISYVFYSIFTNVSEKYTNIIFQLKDYFLIVSLFLIYSVYNYV